MKIASVLKLNAIGQGKHRLLTHCAEGYVTGMNNVLWEVEESEKCCLGVGEVCLFCWCAYSFITGSPEDNFYTYPFGKIIFVKYFTVLSP